MMPWKVSLFSTMKKTLRLPVQRQCRSTEERAFSPPTHLGGADQWPKDEFLYKCMFNIIELKTPRAAKLYGAQSEKVMQEMHFCKK